MKPTKEELTRTYQVSTKELQKLLKIPRSERVITVIETVNDYGVNDDESGFTITTIRED